MRNQMKIVSLVIITILIACIFGLIVIASTSFIKPKANYASIGSINAKVGELKSNESNFFINDDEALLKKTGLMGTIVRKNDDGSLVSRNLYTIGAVGDKLTTEGLTLNSLDYSVVNDEIQTFSALNYTNKEIDNYCTLIAFVNYRNHNRARIEMTTRKVYVDGSRGLAPYFGMWDIISTLNIIPLPVGLDRHNVVKAQFVYGKNSLSIGVGQIIDNSQNKVVTINKNFTFSTTIDKGIAFDGGNVTAQAGQSFTFTYGYAESEQYIYGSTTKLKDYQFYAEFWGNQLNGITYVIAPNESDSLSFQVAERVAYKDEDSDPDGMFAYAGIGAIEIDGKFLAPDLTYGDFNSNPGLRCLGTAIIWSVDNKYHSYLTNLNGTTNYPVRDISSNSNLNSTDASHLYEEGATQ